MANQFTYKLTTESENFTFDFNPVLGTSETLSTATCSIIVQQGTDPSPSSMLSGSPVISAGKATQRVLGGLDEVTYRLIMTVTTNQGNTLTLTGDLPIYSPASV